MIRFTWMGLISQAGVTLGLSLLVAREIPGVGDVFVAVTTAVIIVHLLLGPVLLKVALVRAG
ncbi:MAG: transporter, partial [Gammaproteobacteria bacterium]|nr:transporter [Gemmatimonadota bacterium]NIU78360.1 transporter [Gammaproteobacteria bacterium]